MSKRSLSEYEIHPAADLFPMMSEAEYEGLKEDIRLHGQNDDVMLWNGKLVDGRNRLRACYELGIELGWAELPTTLDPVAWVLSHNLHRRHLTTSQRAMVATKLATLRDGEKKAGAGIQAPDNQHKKEVAGIQATSQAAAAKQLNVSRDSVQKARKVRAKATPTVVAAVEAGTLSLNAALATTKAATSKPKPAKPEMTPAERAAKIRSTVNQHVAAAVRGVDDLNIVLQNYAARDVAVKVLQSLKLW